MEIGIEGVSKSYATGSGAAVGVAGVDLTVRRREFLTLMGSSGAGKSTLLHLISGAVRPDSGRVRFDGRDVTGEPPERRRIHTVFQGLHLFPHMTVLRNVAFPLEQLRPRPPAAEIRARAEAMLEQVGLAGCGPRSVHQLSGGEKQRVAIARSIVDAPHALLLDEPFAPLDRSLKETLVELILSIKRRLGITIVLTTHDWYEALQLSDRIAVMSRGRIAQIGAPEELYRRPRTALVARLTGPVSVLTGRLDDGMFEPGPGEPYAIRPAFVRLEGPLEGRVEEVTFGGEVWRLRIRLAGGQAVSAESERAAGRGAAVRVGLPAEHLARLEPDA